MKYKLQPADQQRLDELYSRLKAFSSTQIGYPCGSFLDNQGLARFLDVNLNNIGDPYDKNYYQVNSFELEREVIDLFGNLLKIENHWGYITNGGTEGNFFGLYLARQKYPNGIVYYSSESHYSIKKSIMLLGMKSKQVPALPTGELNLAAFEQTIDPRLPVIACLNVGTTMVGAIDDVNGACRLLEWMNVKSYVHCDAALFGAMVPFVAGIPSWHPMVDSTSISGHKFIGCPVPCGIAICKKEHRDGVMNDVEYIGGYDCTIAGSRDGLSPIILWSAVKKYGLDGFLELVLECFFNRNYLMFLLKQIGVECWANKYSNIVIIPNVRKELIEKWQLATQKSISHVIVMPHVTRDRINAFVKDMS
jgi:histidine decarboxylase